MPLATEAVSFSPEAYLEWEKNNNSKHEYLNGEVFALAGAKDAHVTLCINLVSQLHSYLRGGPCRVYMADMKVSVERANAFFYPDVVVTRDERDRETVHYKRFPTLIVEVLSESTAAFDRGNKFSAYRKLDSLREYVLIDPDTLRSICFSAPVESLYENVVTIST